MHTEWTTKYSPRKLADIVNQKGADTLSVWLHNWKPGSTAAMLWGTPGSGKTSTAYALARENGLQIIEVNASDHRNAEEIEKRVGEASKQQSLFAKGKIILVDEVDGIAGSEDRGGVGALRKVIKESKFPIILTANSAYDPKLRELRNESLLIEFKKLAPTFIVKRLQYIAQMEGKEVDEKALKLIAAYSSGDLRSAIKDFETVAIGRSKVSEQDLEALGYREREQNIFDVVRFIFKTSSLRTAIDAVQNSDKDPQEVFWWVEQNIPAEYESIDEIAKAYDYLSKSDLFSSRVFSRQNFRFKRYAMEMLAAVAIAKKQKYSKFTAYRPPERLLRYGQTKTVRAVDKSAAEKVASTLHISKQKLKVEYIPFLNLMKPEERQSLADASRLEPEETGFLNIRKA